MASKNVVILNNDNFENEVLKSKTPVLVDFWATWCGPCRMMTPVMDELADKYEGRVKVAKLDVDEGNDVATKFRVMAVPTLIVFKDGAAVERISGARPTEAMSEIIDKHI